MIGKKEPPKHTEINKAARELNEEFPSLPFEAVRRSVLRHWPNPRKSRDEVRAKAEQPCVLGIQLVGTQGQYISCLQRDFYPVRATDFPFLASSFRHVSTGDAQQHTWGDVLQKLSSPATPKVHWILVHCPLGVAPTVEKYEELYEKVVLAEGVKDIVGLAHACDGTLPFGDYISLRHSGASQEEVAALVDFAALRCEADAVDRRMKEDDVKDDDGIIEKDGEEAERLEEAKQLIAKGARRASGSVAAARGEVQGSEEAAEPITGTPPGSAPQARVTAEQAALQSKRLYRWLNLFGNDPGSAIPWRENKAGMHRRLAEVGLNHIRSFEAGSVTEAESRLAEAAIAFPVVVKPVSGAGSEFVTLCRDLEEVRTAFGLCENLLTTQRTSAARMVVEEYIDGAEYVVNTVGFEGRHVVTDVWRSWKYPQQTTSTRLRFSVEAKVKQRAAKDGSVKVPQPVTTVSLLYDRLEFVHDLAHLDPSSEPRRVVEYTLAAVAALQMVNGCSHCEIRVDERPDSPHRGQPVLIELNPRMQGDVPRASQLVGYDQYTLLYYLSAVAAAYEAPSDTPFPFNPPRPPPERCSLPWPPVPTLYQSRQPRLAPGEEPVTRHVVFLTVPENGVVCRYGVQQAVALPTFLRVTRGNLFSAPRPNHLTTVCKTVDLYSSPGACVMEGTESDIRRDTARLRQLEAARISETARNHLEEALKALALQRESENMHYVTMQQLPGLESQLESARRVYAVLAAPPGATTGDNGSGTSGSGSEASFSESDDTNSTEGTSDNEEMKAQEAERENAARQQKLEELLHTQSDLSSKMAELQSKAQGLLEQSRNARAAFQRHQAAAVAALDAAPTPPLFLAQQDFELFMKAGVGHLLALRHVVGTDEEEAETFFAVKHPQLMENLTRETSSAPSPRVRLRERLEWFHRLFL